MANDITYRSRVTKYVKRVAGDTGRNITAVSGDYHERLDARVRNIIREDVHKHPSGFKTLK